MHRSHEERRQLLPPALPDDPPLGVHAVTEFIFCPRAGILAWEKGATDIGEEEPPPRLDFLPRFDVRLMEEELNRRLNRLWLFCALFLVGTGTLCLATYFRAAIGLVIALVGTVGAGWLACCEIRAVVSLVGLIRQAKRTRPLEPSSPLLEVEDVNWWELLAAGFISKRYDEEEFLRDEELKLTGKPWRILARGSLRIPVFLQRRPTDRLYPQHFARIAAYCHLVELATGFESPYGIVLHAGAYSGFAVPNSIHAVADLNRGLDDARNTILALRREHRIPAAPSSSICKNCPLARPEKYQRSVWQFLLGRGFGTLPFLYGAKGKRYCSQCGDRFRWIPPHADLERLGISRG